MLICISILILLSFVSKTDEEEAETIILLIFVMWGCFNFQWVKGGGVGQKMLFRASWNCIFCLLLLLKSWSVRGASHHSAFIVLELIKGTSRRCESKIFFCYPRGLTASPPLWSTTSKVAEFSACGVFVDD